MPQKFRPRFGELMIEWFFKLVFGVILLIVFLAIFVGLGALAGIGTHSDIVAQYGETGGAIIIGAMLIALGIIVAAIMSSLKR